MSAADFNELDLRKREDLEKAKNLSSYRFDPQKWETLREITYGNLSLGTDVVIDDTTLREGIQMAGLVSPHPSEACKLAHMLRDLGVERIEVLVYTKSDQEAVKLMKDEGLLPTLAGWSRAMKEDVDMIRKLDFQQIGISHPVSYIHFEKWPEVPIKTLVDRVTEAVEYARGYGMSVFVHGEDSTRADWDFERRFINAVAEAGASVYRICDTVGCGLSDPRAPVPRGIPEKIRRIKRETSIPHVEIHAHDDLGNAVENTMAAIRAAGGLYNKVYASTTFLGIGDRAGNAETEKIMMNCYIHYGVKKWNLSLLRELALFVASALHYNLPINKAIVGDGAFAHESGIHLHGVRSLPLTYEPFPPELVGHERTIVVGKRSGKHGIKLKLEEMTKREVNDDDQRLAALVEIIRKKFVEGMRRYPLGEEEFKKLAQKVGFEV